MKIVKLARHAENPILMPRPGFEYDEYGAFNPAAAIGPDGLIHMLYRAASNKMKSPASKFGIATIGHAVSEDGIHFHDRSDKPVIGMEGEDPSVFVIDGVEDPRITKIGDTYYIVYVITSWPCWDYLAMASTKDFKTYTKLGLVMPEFSQRTAALFPEKINGKYMLLHRPIPNMWIAASENLKHWETPQLLVRHETLPWSDVKIGVCAPPIRTSKAWAVIFHGKDHNYIYRLGIMWLDLENPAKVLYIQPEPILVPEADYETKNGMTGNTVYACGALVKDGTVFVYYGAGDSYTCVATMPEEDLELPF